jgi:ketosteroid isomerase-like protein
MSHLGIIYGQIESGEGSTDEHPSRVTDNIERAEQTVTPGVVERETEISRRSVIGGVGAISVIGLAGCLGGESDESKIRSVLQKQADSLENGDVDGYMETMHPESPVYDNTREIMEQLVEEYDFEVEIDINSVEVDGDTATAEVTQVTRTEEPDTDFDDNRLEATHELRTYENEWRLYDSTTEDIEYL